MHVHRLRSKESYFSKQEQASHHVIVVTVLRQYEA